MKKLLTAFVASLLCAAALATTHVNDSGTWRNLVGVFVNDSGTWRTITGIWVNDSGTWRQVYAAVKCDDFTIHSEEVSPTDSYAGLRIGGTGPSSNAGHMSHVTGSNLSGSTINDHAWVIPAAAAANYDIRVTQLSGTVNVDTGTGPASLNTWINMDISTTGTFYAVRTVSTPGTTTATAQVDIRPAGGGDTLDSCVVTLQAEVVSAS